MTQLCQLMLLALWLLVSGTNAVRFHKYKPSYTPAKISISGYLESQVDDGIQITPDDDVEIELREEKEETSPQQHSNYEVQSSASPSDRNNFESQARFFGITTSQGNPNQLVTRLVPYVFPIPNPLGRYVKVFETATVTRAIAPVCLACTCLVGPAAPCTTCDYKSANDGKKGDVTDKTTLSACLQAETKCAAYCVDPDVFSRDGVANRPAYCGTACECAAAGTPVKCSPAASGVISTLPSTCSSARSLTNEAVRYRRAADNTSGLLLANLETQRSVPDIVSSQEPSVRQGRVINLFGENVVRVTNTVTLTSSLSVTATLAVGALGCLPVELASSPLC